MHPDAILAGLRRELDQLDHDADDYADRKKAIEAETERVDKLPRPEVAPERPETTVDHNIAYLAGLKSELERVGRDDEERVGEIKAEIERVEGMVHKSEKRDDRSPGDDLDSLTRDELNERATAAGVENPDKLHNKDAVIAAIKAARA
jgi:hypothetical protein